MLLSLSLSAKCIHHAVTLTHLHADHKTHALSEAIALVHSLRALIMHMHDTLLANNDVDLELGFDNHEFIDTLDFGHLVACMAVLEQKSATHNQNVTNLNFLVIELVRCMASSIPNVAPMNGGPHGTSPLSHTSLGANVLSIPITQEASSMLNSKNLWCITGRRAIIIRMQSKLSCKNVMTSMTYGVSLMT